MVLISSDKDRVQYE